MALDSSELIADVEDEFQVMISDQEGAGIRSVGGVCELLCEKLNGPAAAMSSRAFYRTARAIADAANVPRVTIGPDTVLDPLLPMPERVKHWSAMARGSGLEFPALVHAKRSKDRFMLLSLAIAAVPVGALWWSLYALGWLPGIAVWLFSGPAFIAWVVLISRLHRRFLLGTPHLAVEIPCDTAGELATAVLALNMDQLEAEMTQESLSSEAILRRLTKVVAERLQVAAETVDDQTPIGEVLRAR